jgi:hydroxypyruvate isomerase
LLFGNDVLIGGAMGFRLDANLGWLFTELPFEQRFDAARAAGFEAVEFPDPTLAPLPRIAALLRDAGLRQILINSPAGPADGPGRAGWAAVPGAETEFQASFEQALEAATALGARVIHLRAGLAQPGMPRAETLALVTERVAWAADAAAGTGVLPVLEAQNPYDAPGFAFESIDEPAEIVRALGRARVGLLLDIYHLQVMHGDIVRRVRSLLPLTAHIQIADPPTRTEPGTGELGWRTIFRTLADAGYDGWVGCEYRPSTTTAASLSWRDAYDLEPTDASEQE